ncbi:3-phosphoshikimate 1-carboxyvinyltransferase [Flavobacterium sp. MFBS3-15]|uniref:3-phosphoshikimate 1-carboxyvinyltransferase n=1 Tax=Flavobacterium sp. MFBS3-15 TaxID=2989816 RepID=UPI0022365364|nr:3-phosphoshikimate 1-carboxyvinyltransferase [Flavobacterium sp. MFBS3-15]MCW4468283.1 3-phosphoshikimate 1-carboxyvinyltransferase [Flavobacterium sp. MFBS3-15]
MDIRLTLPVAVANRHIKISGSKSETNRLLLLQALFPGITIENASSSDDSEVMLKALAGNDDVVDIHHAGTAMRFLTAYYAQQESREVVLTGSARMKERPIAILVDALRSLGASIEYAEEEGFPPLKIIGRKLSGGRVTLPANISSQYITALLLIAGRLDNGLELTLEGEITSRPYIEMTLALLKEIGIAANFQGNRIIVQPATGNRQPATINLTVESDWSSASYFYSIIALSPEGTAITLSSYKKDSLQGDSALQHIYRKLGVETKFDNDTITLRKENRQLSTVNCQLNNTPDIAQTIAVTCFGLGIGCHLTGLHTLKIKETDRLSALKAELGKLGAKVDITDDTLTLYPHSLFTAGVLHLGSFSFGEGWGEDPIQTYNDHRMAMAFAPLAIKRDIIIQDAGVVSKSYPVFWDDLKRLGFEITAL